MRLTESVSLIKLKTNFPLNKPPLKIDRDEVKKIFGSIERTRLVRVIQASFTMLTQLLVQADSPMHQEAAPVRTTASAYLPAEKSGTHWPPQWPIIIWHSFTLLVACGNPHCSATAAATLPPLSPKKKRRCLLRAQPASRTREQSRA